MSTCLDIDFALACPPHQNRWFSSGFFSHKAKTKRLSQMAGGVTRRLEGVTYWVMNDRKEIRRFINANVRREWEEDNKNDGIDSRKDNWLLSLSSREWRLRTTYMGWVRLNPVMMASTAFTTRLQQRSEEMQRSITSYGIVIWPLVIRGEDHELKDGYCRYMALRNMGISKVLAYVGLMPRR